MNDAKQKKLLLLRSCMNKRDVEFVRWGQMLHYHHSHNGNGDVVTSSVHYPRIVKASTCHTD